MFLVVFLLCSFKCKLAKILAHRYAPINPMKKILVWLHRYAGLSLGALLCLIGLTGSTLVFDHALDELLNPTLVTPISKTAASWQQVIDQAELAMGGQRAVRINVSRQAGSPHTVRFDTAANQPGPTEVSVSPATGEVLAVRIWGKYTMTWLYRLHYTLLAGKTGKYIVGSAGVVLLFFVISGLILWWPKRARFKKSLRVNTQKGPFRLHYDLHKVVGIYTLPVVLVIAFSGVSLVFFSSIKAAVSLVLPVEKPPVFSITPNGQPLPIDEITERAQSVWPASRLLRIYLPKTDTEPYRLAFNQPGEPWHAHSATQVYIDPYSGETLWVNDILKAKAGDAFMGWQFPLHNGDALGLAGRIIVLISGLLPSLFFITGVYMWLFKRRKRRAAQKN